YVEIESSDPTALIYFTTDGTTPNPLSQLYLSRIELPRDGLAFTLTAIAYQDDGGSMIPSNVASYTWSLDNSSFFLSRDAPRAQVVYMYPGGLDIPFWYDSEGNTAHYLDIPENEIGRI